MKAQVTLGGVGVMIVVGVDAMAEEADAPIMLVLYDVERDKYVVWVLMANMTQSMEYATVSKRSCSDHNLWQGVRAEYGASGGGCDSAGHVQVVLCGNCPGYGLEHVFRCSGVQEVL